MSGVRIVGGDRLIRNLSRRGRAAERMGDYGLKLLADEIEEESRARTPERTGKLVESHRVVQTKEGYGVMVGPVYNDGVEYSVMMHEGLGWDQDDMDLEPYELGRKSRSKNAGKTAHYGRGVGWKFLERASKSVMRDAVGRLGNIIGKALR